MPDENPPVPNNALVPYQPDQSATTTVQFNNEQHGQITVRQRAVDNYIDAASMDKWFSLKLREYLRTKTTQKFLTAASKKEGRPIKTVRPGRLSTDSRSGNLPNGENPDQRPLIDVVKGGVPEMQGTWIHPTVAIHFAFRLTPELALEMIERFQGSQQQNQMLRKENQQQAQQIQLLTQSNSQLEASQRQLEDKRAQDAAHNWVKLDYILREVGYYRLENQDQDNFAQELQQFCRENKIATRSWRNRKTGKGLVEYAWCPKLADYADARAGHYYHLRHTPNYNYAEERAALEKQNAGEAADDVFKILGIDKLK